MKTKLTLSIDSEVIDKAKSYARSHNSNVSSIFERLINALSEESAIASKDGSPITTSLIGRFKNLDIDNYNDELLKNKDSKYA